MTAELFLNTYFDSIVEEIEGGTFGSKYKCELGKNEYFVKVRSANSGWKSWGLRKEYKVCNSMNVGGKQPKAHMLIEDDEYIAVAFSFVKNSNSISRIYKDKKYYEQFLKQIVDFLSELQSVGFESNPSLRSLRNESHFVEGRLTSCKDYMFNDRLEGGVFFSDRYYDEYKSVLRKARSYAQSNYSQDRETLVHGDLQNPDNILCDDTGLNVIVDWEICGFFDYLYDLASVESKFIDRPSDYWDGMIESEVRESFRSEFGISSREANIIDAYKVWNQYLELEVHNSNDLTLPSSRTQESEVEFIRNRIEELEASFS